MPLYEYKCEACQETFEEIVTLKEYDKLPPCPKCKSKQTKKLISAGRFDLTGDGWFQGGFH
jgi:putative FmdB family regulatory protein